MGLGACSLAGLLGTSAPAPAPLAALLGPAGSPLTAPLGGACSLLRGPSTRGTLPVSVAPALIRAILPASLALREPFAAAGLGVAVPPWFPPIFAAGFPLLTAAFRWRQLPGPVPLAVGPTTPQTGRLGPWAWRPPCLLRPGAILGRRGLGVSRDEQPGEALQ